MLTIRRRAIAVLVVVVRGTDMILDRLMPRDEVARPRYTLPNFFGGSRVGGPICSLERCPSRNGERDPAVGDRRLFLVRYDVPLSKRSVAELPKSRLDPPAYIKHTNTNRFQTF